MGIQSCGRSWVENLVDWSRAHKGTFSPCHFVPPVDRLPERDCFRVARHFVFPSNDWNFLSARPFIRSLVYVSTDPSTRGD